jgi:hypothetical protein
MSGPAQIAQQVQQHGKPLVDAVSVVTLVGSLTEHLPAIAAVFTIVWTAIRIWETETVKAWRAKWKNRA